MYACTPCLLFRCCGVGSGTSSSSATEAAHFLLFVFFVAAVALPFCFCASTDSMSDVSGVSDCSEVFVLNIGDLTVEGVAEVDALDFARVLARVVRAMSRGEERTEGKGRDGGVLAQGGCEQEKWPTQQLGRETRSNLIYCGRPLPTPI